MSTELSNTNSYSPSKQPTDYGCDLLAFSCAAFGIWIVAPVLHGAGWPIAAASVSAFFNPENLEFARKTHAFASLLLAYSSVFTVAKITFELMHQRFKS